MASFRNLVVWQRAFGLCIDLYRTTERFPAAERFGLTSEVRKTARSIVYNIAEGHRRASARDFARFLDISHGSAAELETQLLLAQSLSYLEDRDADAALGQLDEVARMLVGLKHSLRP
jgi:four helix bundle protein